MNFEISNISYTREFFANNLKKANIKESQAYEIADYIIKHVIGKSHESTYLKKENTGLPFTLEINDGHIFVLLKGKHSTTKGSPFHAWGSYKKITAAIDTETGQKVAHYVIKITPLSTLQSELELMEKYGGISIIGKIQSHVKKNNQTVLTVIAPFAEEGTAENLTKFGPHTAKKLMQDIAYAIQKMHKDNIAHRDIKPQNILIFKEKGALVAKLCDFGKSSANTLENQNNDTGTKQYKSPYFLKGKNKDLLKSDLWALGVTFLVQLHPDKFDFIYDYIVDEEDSTKGMKRLEKFLSKMQEENKEYKEIYAVIKNIIFNHETITIESIIEGLK